MFRKKLKTVDDVVKWRLCTGCGACVSVCEQKSLEMIDVIDIGLRPLTDQKKCEKCGDCLKVCPGISIIHDKKYNSKNSIKELYKSWGPVLEVWEGYATDNEIRFLGSSGGITTALSLFCIEKKQMSGALQIKGNPEFPWKNIPFYSKTLDDLKKSTGSRYSPSSICEKFNWITEADSQSVFTGKPCDIAAMRKFQELNPDFSKKVGLVISIFCAGTPSTRGTINVLKSLNVNRDELQELRYRGKGWPGMASAKMRGNGNIEPQMTYRESWDKILNPCVQFNCRICPDHTGELSDISCGDPWYCEIDKDDPGRSLILVRSEKGRKILKEAKKEGYIEIEQKSPEIVSVSQDSLLRNRQHLYGRLLAMRLTGLPAPKYSGFNLRMNFNDLSLPDKIRSVVGTIKRIFKRGMIFPQHINKQK